MRLFKQVIIEYLYAGQYVLDMIAATVEEYFPE